MIFYGCLFCSHFNKETFKDCSAFPDGIPLAFLSGLPHDEILDEQEGDEVFELKSAAYEVPIEIENRESLERAIFWVQEDFQSIGSVEGTAVIQVGLISTDKLVIVADPLAIDPEEEELDRAEGIEIEPVPPKIVAQAIPLKSLQSVNLYEEE